MGEVLRKWEQLGTTIIFLLRCFLPVTFFLLQQCPVARGKGSESAIATGAERALDPSVGLWANYTVSLQRFLVSGLDLWC